MGSRHEFCSKTNLWEAGPNYYSDTKNLIRDWAMGSRYEESNQRLGYGKQIRRI